MGCCIACSALRSLTSRSLTTSPTRNRQSMSMFSRPRRRLAQQPCAVLPGDDPVHFRHRPAPLDRVAIDRLEVEQRAKRERQIAGLQRDDQLVIDRAVEVLAIAVDLRGDRGVVAEALRRSRRDRARPTRLRHVHDAEHMRLLEEPRHDVVDGAHAVDERHVARLVEAHVDDVALGRRDGDVVDPGLALVAAQIRGDDLHPRRRPRNDRLNTRVLDTLVRNNRTTSPRRTRAVPARLAVDEQHVAEPAHQRVRRRLAAVAHQARVSATSRSSSISTSSRLAGAKNSGSRERTSRLP